MVMSAVMIIPVQFRELFFPAEVLRDNPLSEQVSVQLRSENGDTTFRYALFIKFNSVIY